MPSKLSEVVFSATQQRTSTEGPRKLDFSTESSIDLEKWTKKKTTDKAIITATDVPWTKSEIN